MYYAAIAVVLYKFIYMNSHNFDQSESYHIFTAVFFLMLPWVYVQLILVVVLVKLFRKPVFEAPVERKNVEEIKNEQSAATDSTLEENLNAIQ